MYKVKENERERKNDIKKNLGGARAKAVCVLERVRASTELSALASACSYLRHSILRSILAAGRRELASLRKLCYRSCASVHQFSHEIRNSERKVLMVKLGFRLFAWTMLPKDQRLSMVFNIDTHCRYVLLSFKKKPLVE